MLASLVFIFILLLFNAIFALSSANTRTSLDQVVTSLSDSIETTTQRIQQRMSEQQQMDQQTDISDPILLLEDRFPTLFKYSNSDAPNLFKEYLIRGQYSCTAKYMDILTRLNALMKGAYEEHESCLKAMQQAPTYDSTEFDPLNDLLEEWKNSDDDLSEPGHPMDPSIESSSPQTMHQKERNHKKRSLKIGEIFLLKK